mgnify:CR=1 FL=1
MNKILFYILIVIAIALIGYNATQIDLEAPMIGQSGVALICIAAALCAIVLLAILLVSKKIKEKVEE